MWQFQHFLFLYYPPDKTQVWYRDEQQKQNRLWFEVGTQVVGFKAFSKSSQKGTPGKYMLTDL